MKQSIGLFLFFIAIVLQANDLVLDLNGFRIGQYREVIERELGSPIQKGKYNDGFEYEIYLVKPDTSLYMIFEFSSINLEIIWSVQLTGSEFVTDFKNLNLGMIESEVIKVLGVPSRKVDVGEYGEKFEFDGTNYSVEVNTDGKLSSIKITDQSNKMYPKVDVEKIPSYDKIVSILQSDNRERIKDLLSPDMEIYTSDSTYFFGYKMAKEVREDISGIFEVISVLAKGLERIGTKSIEQYEENVRLILG